jgi:hypothetical protein
MCDQASEHALKRGALLGGYVAKELRIIFVSESGQGWD